MLTKTCQGCGSEFETFQRRAKWCPACRQRRHNADCARRWAERKRLEREGRLEELAARKAAHAVSTEADRSEAELASIHDRRFKPAPASDPTNLPPGPPRVDLYRGRVSRGEEPFSPLDRDGYDAA